MESTMNGSLYNINRLDIPPRVLDNLAMMSSVKDDAYVIVSATLSTLAITLNISQIIVIVFIVRCWKSLYFLNLCLCGVVTSMCLMWYMSLVHRTEGVDHFVGAIVPSGLNLAVIAGYTANLTVIIGHKYITDTWYQFFLNMSRSRALCVILSTLTWFQVATVSMAPMTQWAIPPKASRQYAMLAGDCLLPYVWSVPFSRFVAAFQGLQLSFCLILLIDATLSAACRSHQTPQADEYDDQILTKCPACPRDVKMLWIKFIIIVLGTCPMSGFIAYHAFKTTVIPTTSSSIAAAATTTCSPLTDMIVVWSLLASVLLAIALPLLHIFTDEVICKATIYLIQTILCTRRRRVAPMQFYLNNNNNTASNSNRLHLNNNNNNAHHEFFSSHSHIIAAYHR